MDLPERLNTSVPSNASNVSNHDAPSWSQYKSSLTPWFVTTLCTSVVCGLINLVFLVAIWTTKKLRTGSGILIGHLTAMEMSMCLVHMPVFLVGTIVHSQSLFTCRFTQFLFAMTNVIGAYNMLSVAVNRFVAVVLPLHYRQITTPKWLAVFIIVPWFMAIVITIPMVLPVNGGFSINPRVGGCAAAAYKPGQFDYRPISPALQTYLPITLTGILYITLLAFAWLKPTRVGANDAAGNGTSESASRSQRRKLALCEMLFLSAIVYSILYFAFPILGKSLPMSVMLTQPLLPLWMITVYVVGHAVHPVFVTLNSSTYRDGVRELLRRVLGRPCS